MEAVSWLDRYSRMTRRLADAVIQSCKQLPTLHVAQLFGVHWDSVRLLDRRALQAELDKLPVARPRRLLMDEFGPVQRTSIRQCRTGWRYPSSTVDR